MTTIALPARFKRSRMLAALALAGAAALVTGCGIQTSGSGTPTAPGNPPPAIVGADPVALDGAQLQAPGLFDEVSEQGYALRWMVPGESIAVVVGGSGGGGECIPQPQAAGLEPNAPSIVVRFDPPNPEVMCTADFTLHGWELGLAEPIDAASIVPVRFVNLHGTDDLIDLELGPDSVLAGETADPQPSIIPDAGDTPAPTPIPAAQLPSPTALQQGEGALVEVRWVEAGRSIAVVLAGSGTEACVPQPIGAMSSGPGSIEVSFEPAVGQTCTDDLVVYGWRITLPEAASATMPVAVRVTGMSDAGPSVDATLEPGDILELP